MHLADPVISFPFSRRTYVHASSMLLAPCLLLCAKASIRYKGRRLLLYKALLPNPRAVRFVQISYIFLLAPRLFFRSYPTSNASFPQLSHPDHLIAPYMPFCTWLRYCLLVAFHAPMYFSMQLLKQVCSPDDSEEPGVGTQRSKQCSLIFCA